MSIKDIKDPDDDGLGRKRNALIRRHNSGLGVFDVKCPRRHGTFVARQVEQKTPGRADLGKEILTAPDWTAWRFRKLGRVY